MSRSPLWWQLLRLAGCAAAILYAFLILRSEYHLLLSVRAVEATRALNEAYIARIEFPYAAYFRSRPTHVAIIAAQHGKLSPRQMIRVFADSLWFDPQDVTLWWDLAIAAENDGNRKLHDYALARAKLLAPNNPKLKLQ